MTNYRFAFAVLIALSLAIFGKSNASAQVSKPNIVIVMTDDQGYPELGSHGNPILKTPHLDQLAEESVRFSDFHVTPMCAPTRGQLLTGLDAARNGAINVSSGRALLRTGIPTMGNLFADAGWATGIFGKWHLGANYPFRPEDRGFQETLWFPSSHIGSVTDYWGNDYFDDTYVRNGRRQSFEGYSTDVFFDEAMAFMKRSADAKRPFLAYIATNTPHWPFYVKQEDQAAIAETLVDSKFADMSDDLKNVLSRYLGMIRNIDTNMGRLVQFLEEEGLRKDTILVFLTDNGSIFGPSYYNAGMRGQKTELWEGGHRVPLFISWPNGELAKPAEIGGLTQVQDILPTLLDLAGVESNEVFDGMSLADIVRGKSEVPEDRTVIINYSRMPSFVNYPTPYSQTLLRRDQAAVLWKRWRLLEDRELFDLSSDPLQETNVIDKYPAVVERMREDLYRWWDDVGPEANEPQRVIIGSDHENPSLLAATEWLNVFLDMQQQIQLGVQKSGYWLLEVAEDGVYEFELRRWPRELGRPIAAGDAEGNGAIPIRQASLYVSDYHHVPLSEKVAYGFEGLSKEVRPSDAAVVFTLPLERGPIALHTWFQGAPITNADGITVGYEDVLSAYYVYVSRR